MKIDQTRVLSKAQQLETCCDNLLEQIRKYQYAVEHINEIWSGDDALKFVNSIVEKHIPQLENLHGVLVEYGVYLKTVPDTYIELDNIYASKHIEV